MKILTERGFTVFKKSPEQKIMQEADRIVSMKEDFDAVSWSRVSEIAKLLQEEHSDEQRLEWARELMSIARSNTWVLDKFGVAASSMTGTVISSGIEMQQDDQYLTNADASIPPSAAVQPQNTAPVFAQQQSVPREAEQQSSEQSKSVPQVAAHADMQQNEQSHKSVEDVQMPTLNEVAENLGTSGGLPRIPSFGLPEIAPEAAAGVIASLPKLDLFLSGADAFSTVASDPVEDDRKIEPPLPSANRGFNIPFGRDRTNDPAEVHYNTARHSADLGQVHQASPVEATQTTPGMGLLSSLPRAFSDDETEMLSDAERELRALEVMYAMMAAENGELAKSDIEPVIEPKPVIDPVVDAELELEPEPKPEPVVEPQLNTSPKPDIEPKHAAEPKVIVKHEQVHETNVEPKTDHASTVVTSQLSPDEVAANVKRILFDLPEIKQEETPKEVHQNAVHQAVEVNVQQDVLPQSTLGDLMVAVTDAAASPLSTEDNKARESYIETKGDLRKKRKKKAFGRHGGKATSQDEQPMTSAPTPESSGVPVVSSAPEIQSAPESQSTPLELPSEIQGTLDKRDLARFKHVYSGKRGKLCLYEDADGHLVAVDPSRFA